VLVENSKRRRFQRKLLKHAVLHIFLVGHRKGDLDALDQ
jgi:hypothetical protein